MWFNRWNQKFDIGSGMNLHKRLKEYFYPSRLSNNRAINKALSKYGHHSFILMILYNFNSQVDRNLLLNKEQYYMDLFKPVYNMTKSAFSSEGRILSDETKKKISLANQGKTRNFSKEHKWNLSQSQLNNKKGNKKMEVYDLNHNLLYIFNSRTEAALFFNIPRNNITRYKNKPFKNQYIFKFY